MISSITGLAGSWKPNCKGSAASNLKKNINPILESNQYKIEAPFLKEASEEKEKVKLYFPLE